MVTLDDKVLDFSSEPLPPRSEFLLDKTRDFFRWWLKRSSHVNLEMPGETSELISNPKSAVLFASSHKSLWETVGIPYAIDKTNDDVPYVVMGSNLVKGVGFLMHRLGVVYVERGKDTRFRTPLILKAKLNYLLANNQKVLIFPEGTRSKTGMIDEFKRTFAASALEVSKHADTYIVPVNTDYSDLNFRAESALIKSSAPYTFKLLHARHWIRHMEDIYITFGMPTKVIPTMSDKELAAEIREQCKRLVKILPINIVSEAATREMTYESRIDPKNLNHRILQVRDELSSHKEQFRGFDDKTIPQVLMRLSGIPILKDLEHVYRLYSGYINHYLPSEWHRDIGEEKRIMAGMKPNK